MWLIEEWLPTAPNGTINNYKCDYIGSGVTVLQPG